MNDPRVVAALMIVFILLGVYNVFTGLRRQREAQLRGQRIRWYKQINLLTGIEFLLLSFVFIAELNLRNAALPSILRSTLAIFYLMVLLATAVFAGFVIRQVFVNTRQSATSRQDLRDGAQVDEANNEELTPEQRAANIQRRRERRQKAAAQRRRRAGRT